MSKIISAPEIEIYTGEEVSLTPIDLEKECPGLIEYFQSYEQASKEEELKKVGRRWYRTGNGPAPEEGGIWVGGRVLIPFEAHLIPSNAAITKIEYSWDNTNLRGWNRQVSVRLLVHAGNRAGVADITAHNNGVIKSDGSLLAKAQIQFQMKVGSFQASLYKPPYISVADVHVYY